MGICSQKRQMIKHNHIQLHGKNMVCVVPVSLLVNSILLCLQRKRILMNFRSNSAELKLARTRKERRCNGTELEVLQTLLVFSQNTRGNLGVTVLFDFFWSISFSVLICTTARFSLYKFLPLNKTPACSRKYVL